MEMEMESGATIMQGRKREVKTQLLCSVRGDAKERGGGGLMLNAKSSFSQFLRFEVFMFLFPLCLCKNRLWYRVLTAH